MVGKLQVGECAIGGLAWNALLAVPLRFRRLRTQRRVREGPLWHIQGGGRSRVSVFSFVKVNGRGNSGRSEEGSGTACGSEEQTQANAADRARGYEKEGGQGLLNLGGIISKLLRPKGMGRVERRGVPSSSKPLAPVGSPPRPSSVSTHPAAVLVRNECVKLTHSSNISSGAEWIPTATQRDRLGN